MTKDTAPPLQSNKLIPNVNINPSPLFSPMHNILNNPMALQNQIFNNNIANFVGNGAPLNKMKEEFNKMHISQPNLPKSIESSPDMSNPGFISKKKENEKGSDWTPEIEKKNIFANLGSRDNNSFDMTGSSIGTPDIGMLFGRSGNSAFRRQPQAGALSNKEELMKSMGIDLKAMENNGLMNQLKTSDSPSLFLNSSRLHSSLL